METTKENVEAVSQILLNSLADKGKIIEGGWTSFQHVAIPKAAPKEQHRDMRLAFFAGAQHLFASILMILEPGEEASEKDLNRMTLIHEELEAFTAELKAMAPK